jgi:Tfp pilus assembly protein FimT
MDRGIYMVMRLNERGITLVEIIVVIALIALMTAIAVPAMSTRMAHTRLVRATRDVAAELGAVRHLAISKNTPYRLSFTLQATPLTDSYARSYLTGGTWTDDPATVSRSISSGVDITSPSSSFDVEFKPNGTADSESICLQNLSDSTDRMEITIYSATGRTEVAKGCTS